MATELVLHMNGGVGERSYANNSALQRSVIFNAKPILEESITRLYGRTSTKFLKVADLGCSSGPNALLVAYEIINIVDAASRSTSHEQPIFQFFLNDLFGNDFNTIFKSIPDFLRRLQQEKGENFGPCFINATPGTFYGKLFPSNSIHFFHSSYGLHFLSQAPKGLNKGNTYITNTTPPSVYKAYLEQFQKDFKLFLKLRSEELVSGGGMVLTFFGRDETRDIITPWGLIGMTLNDMVSENLVEEAKLDSFDLPIYCPTKEEVKQAIREEGSFSLQRMETIKVGWDAGLNEGGDDTVIVGHKKRGEFVANYIRAVTEPLLKNQFGEEIMDQLFHRFGKKVAQLMEVQVLEHANLAMSMTKND